MTLHLRLIRFGGLVAIMMLGLSSMVRAQDAEVATARDLYGSAAYEEALSLLDRLRASGAKSPAVEQYRAFCLIALGRADEAERAIEAVVVAEPEYQPTEDEVSPRVRSAFTDVRRRMLPAIIQQTYRQAKAAFDNKQWADAADGFRRVLAGLADSDIAAAASQPPLSDLKTLALGFEELSAKMATPPPPPVVAAAAPPKPVAPTVYTFADAGVVPPTILNQAMPAYPDRVIIPRNGRVEILIDETGQVESALMTASVTQMYDALVLAATRTWRYRPATINGVPVKFRKSVQIALRPNSSPS